MAKTPSPHNFFWIFYQPQDEREKSLYLEAYSRAFMNMVIVLGIDFVLSSLIHPFFSQSAIIVGAFAAGYLGGWSALAYEEPLTPPTLGEKIRFLPLVLMLAALGAASVIVLGFFPQLFMVAYILAYLIFEGTTRVYAWRRSQSVASVARKLLTVLAPSFLLYFASSRAKTVGKRIISGIVGALCFEVIFAALFIGSALLATLPESFSPDELGVFGAQLKPYTYYYARYFEHSNLKPSDFAIVEGDKNEGDKIVSIVREEQNGFVVITASDETRTIEKTHLSKLYPTPLFFGKEIQEHFKIIPRP